MATNGKPTTRKRIPKLSEKPEPETGRYYTSYRVASGTSRRQRFTRDYKESEQLYRRWVIEHYDDSVDSIVRDGSSLNGNLERTLPYIANAMIQHDKGRVRADGSPRTGGTISLRVFHDDRHQVVNILKMVQGSFRRPPQTRVLPRTVHGDGLRNHDDGIL